MNGILQRHTEGYCCQISEEDLWVVVKKQGSREGLEEEGRGRGKERWIEKWIVEVNMEKW